MPEPGHEPDSLSLWTCLHDGSIEQMASDLMDRTITFIVDSPFHWEFHKLPATTRFKIVGERVSLAELLEFEPWPGAMPPARGTAWQEAQEQLQRNYEKGRLQSVDWFKFVAVVGSNEDVEISHGVVESSSSQATLRLEAMSYPSSNYYDVRIKAEQFRFFVGDRELPLQEFEKFGNAYWNDFANRASRLVTQTESKAQ